jgi:hypothetical protein
MRFALLLLTGFCLTAPLSAQGATLRSTAPEVAPSPDLDAARSWTQRF